MEGYGRVARVFKNDKCFIMYKVLIITQFSNPTIRQRIEVKVSFFERMVRKLLRRPLQLSTDYCQWVTNALDELKKYHEISVFVIAPYSHLKKRDYRFEIDGIHYYFFRDEAASIGDLLLRKLKIIRSPYYHCNRKYIVRQLKMVSPDIVHFIGAENLNTTPSIFDLPNTVPIILQLQTLLNDSVFLSSSLNRYSYNFDARKSCEERAILRADYIASGLEDFVNKIRASIKPGVKALKMTLPVEEPINREDFVKTFDFVYFSRNINKAADYAIEAFIEASNIQPGITLDIVGEYSEQFKDELLRRLNKEHLGEFVRFEGVLETHIDVINQMRKSRVALLPLKVDFVSGTIREAMSNGLPVVTTITEGTPSLNMKRESVLLSGKGDAKTMAKNMIRLLNDSVFYDHIRENAFITASEYSTNSDRIRQTVEIYKACVNDFYNGISMPDLYLYH